MTDENPLERALRLDELDDEQRRQLQEQVEDALDGEAEDVELLEVQEPQRTAAQKIAGSLREMSRPGEDAGELELTLATVAMGLERSLGPELERAQESGELDDFVLALTRWMAVHRSESAKQLLVVELPRRELPAGTRLHLLDEAAKAAESASSPLSKS